MVGMPGFLTGCLGFGIFLDRLLGDFWRILGDVLEGFNTVLGDLGEAFYMIFNFFR